MTMDDLSIKSNEICVVVQGPVYGKTNDCYANQITRRSCESIRKYLPNAEIILSTWEGSTVNELDYDRLVLNKDPGSIEMLLDKEIRQYNTNRMIVSSKNGVRLSKKKYCLKMRSDMILEGTDFIEYFGKYTASNIGKIVEKRIVTLSGNNYERTGQLFQINDWFEFGLTCDLQKRWEIEEQYYISKEDTNIYSRKDNLSPEQYVWISFAKKNSYYSELSNFKSNQLTTKKTIELFYQFVAENLVLCSANNLKVKSLKHPKRFYGRRDFMKMTYFTHNEWKNLYNKYAGGDVSISKPLIERIESNLYIVANKIKNSNKNTFDLLKEIYKKLFMK